MTKNRSAKRQAKRRERNLQVHGSAAAQTAKTFGGAPDVKEQLLSAINKGHGKQVLKNVSFASNLSQLHRVATGKDAWPDHQSDTIKKALETLQI